MTSWLRKRRKLDSLWFCLVAFKKAGFNNAKENWSPSPVPQYRVFPPLALLIASRRRGTLSAKFRTRAAGICCHASCQAFQSSAAVHGSRRLAAVLSSCHKFSIGFASGEFSGQSNSVTSCWRSHCLVDRDVWIGALSCWKTKSSSISAATSVSMCSSRTCWYAVLSKRPSSFSRDPTPCQHIDPHTITLAACWTVRSHHSGRNSSPLRRQTYRAPPYPMLTFDSSVKRTDFQSSKVHCVWVVAHPSRKCRLFSVGSGFF